MFDLQTVNAVASSDGLALNKLMDKYFRLMWSINSTILTCIGTTPDIEECVADTFFYLWEHPEKFDAKHRQPTTLRGGSQHPLPLIAPIN